MNIQEMNQAFELAYIQEFGEIDGVVFFNGEKYELFPQARGFAEFHLVELKINAAWTMWQQAIKNAVHDGFILLPLEPSEAIKTALSYQCFDFIKVAEIYRKHGFDIPKKAEAEQAFFLHKFLILAIKHGNDFVKVFNEETKKMIEENEK